jgi:hypothetical protein
MAGSTRRADTGHRPQQCLTPARSGPAPIPGQETEDAPTSRIKPPVFLDRVRAPAAIRSLAAPDGAARGRREGPREAAAMIGGANGWLPIVRSPSGGTMGLDHGVQPPDVNGVELASTVFNESGATRGNGVPAGHSR